MKASAIKANYSKAKKTAISILITAIIANNVKLKAINDTMPDVVISIKSAVLRLIQCGVFFKKKLLSLSKSDFTNSFFLM